MKVKRKEKVLSIIIAFSILFASLGTFAISGLEIDWENKITATLINEMKNTDINEKLPVCIWYNDINHLEVLNKVKSETGLSASEINTDLEMPDNEILNKILSLSDNNSSTQKDNDNDLSLEEQIKQEMKEYLKRTKIQREYEMKITNDYIVAKRNISKIEYENKGDSIKKSLNLSLDNIDFQSKYAPMIIANMSVKEIEAAAKKIYISELDFYSKNVEYAECFEVTGKETVRINKVISESGLTGNGVKVGMIEGGYPDDTAEKEFIKVGDKDKIEEREHASNTINILAGNNGVAPNIQVYSTNGDFEYIEQMIDYGVSIINVSFGYFSKGIEDEYNRTYNSRDKWYDHISSQHNVTVICSAGNNVSMYVLTPAKAYNSIAVGQYDNNNTPNDYSDDAFLMSDGAGSSYKTGAACQKPDIIAAKQIGARGTSSTAPMVSGFIALMLELKPSLAVSPQLIKAILIASCHRKVSSSPQETMYQGITEKQGAGSVDCYNAISIVGRGQYITGEMSNNTNIMFEQPHYGSNSINVSSAWLVENHFSSGSHTSGTPNVGTINNLRLKLTNNGYSYISNNDNSSTEMLYCNTSNLSDRYKVELLNLTSSTETVRYALAWSIDNSSYRNDNIEGLYYVKSKASNKYLIATSNNNVIKSILSNKEQQWILATNSDGTYRLSTNLSSTSGSLAVGALLDSNGAYSSITSETGDLSIKLEKNNDGSYRILHKKPGTSTWLCLELYNGSTSENSIVSWYPYYGWNNQKWYLEKSNYSLGDVNMDGIINSKDSLALQEHNADIKKLRGSAEYLGDINKDGIINSKDILILKRYIAGYDDVNL